MVEENYSDGNKRESRARLIHELYVRGPKPDDIISRQVRGTPPEELAELVDIAMSDEDSQEKPDYKEN